MSEPRRPVRIIEIDCDRCTRTYGVLPCRAALVEPESRTNLALWSAQLSNAYWTKNLVTITDNALTAPDETVTADLVLETATTGIHRVLRSFSFTSGVTLTLSVHVKPNGRDDVGITLPAAAFGGVTQVRWDLPTLTGVVTNGTPDDHGVEALPDGWYRVWMQATATATASGNAEFRLFDGSTGNYAGDITKGAAFWGLQVEVGAGPSTYKATTSAAVTEVWGTGAAKCFNTPATCQDLANYGPGVQTLRYGENIDGLPLDQTIFPALKSVSTSPVRINMGGQDENYGPLGARARMTVTLQDFQYQDTLTDPYAAERRSGAAQLDGVGYDPLTRGTHFGKHRARQPYFFGRALRRLEGQAGQTLAEMRVRHFVQTDWAGPDYDGKVAVTAQDILTLADDKAALAPALSEGVLSAAMDADSGPTQILLAPATIGSTYDASGRVCIGSEVMRFTRSGDVLTITARGVDGSAVEEHAAGDLVQQCLRFDGVTPVQAMRTLLGFTQIDVDTWFPVGEADDECTRWMGGYRITRTITRPTGVTVHLQGLLQLGCTLWSDDVAQRIRFRATRPADLDEVVNDLTETSEILEKSVSIAGDPKQRVSQVQVWYQQDDPTGSDSDTANYRQAVYAVSDSGTAAKHGVESIRVITMPWCRDDVVAATIAARFLRRFEAIPDVVTVSLDGRLLDVLEPAALARIHSRLKQGPDGAGVALPVQILSVDEAVPGHRFKVVGITFRFDGRFGFVMPADAPDYSAASDAEKARGCFLVDPDTLTFPDGTGPYILF